MANSYGERLKQIEDLIERHVKANYDTKFYKSEQEIVSYFVKNCPSALEHLRTNTDATDKAIYIKALRRLAQKIVDTIIEQESHVEKTK